ncbi:MAG: hypothetical protein L0Y56_02765 [Nitrospira sp.]|nr:hypothetical protein [Nitrospira sp.]
MGELIEQLSQLCRDGYGSFRIGVLGLEEGIPVHRDIKTVILSAGYPPGDGSREDGKIQVIIIAKEEI